jgi:hypothetical protein
MFDNNFDTQRQLEHLEYEVNRTLFIDCQDTFFVLLMQSLHNSVVCPHGLLLLDYPTFLGPHFLC